MFRIRRTSNKMHKWKDPQVGLIKSSLWRRCGKMIPSYQASQKVFREGQKCSEETVTKCFQLNIKGSRVGATQCLKVNMWHKKFLSMFNMLWRRRYKMFFKLTGVKIGSQVDLIQCSEEGIKNVLSQVSQKQL